MKNKIMISLLLILGIILLIVPFVLAVNETAKMDIIGGADFIMLKYVFFSRYGGIYSKVSFWGLVCIISAVVVAIISKKKQKQKAIR